MVAIKIPSPTVRRMKELFPRPRRAVCGTEKPNTYCVLGAMFKYARQFLPDALCCAVNGDRSKLASGKLTDADLDKYVKTFPSSIGATGLLRKLNCSLDEHKAVSFASDVLRLNDDGKFGQAWLKLSEALLYDPKVNCN